MAAGYKTGGRTKGTPNKGTKFLREYILQALDEQDDGPVGYLSRQARENPNAFMTILGKVLPTQIGGDPEGIPIQSEVNLNISPDEAYRKLLEG